MELNEMRMAVLAGFSVLSTAVSRLLGGWDSTTQLLVGLMLADYVTGLMVAGVFKASPKTEGGRLSSAVGFRGICKKSVVLLLVWVACMVDNALGSDEIRVLVLFFFIGNEGLSLLENLGLMGVPYPQKLRDMLEALGKRGDRDAD